MNSLDTIEIKTNIKIIKQKNIKWQINPKLQIKYLKKKWMLIYSSLNNQYCNRSKTN